MNRLRLRIFVAVFTFIIGLSCAYLVWLVYSHPSIAPLDVSLSELSSPQIATSPETRNGETTIDEDWEKLMKVESCLSVPSFSLLNHLPSLKRDERKAIAFLISRIPKTKRTGIHVSPYGMAVEGEVAIYCLQDVCDVPWYELKEEYETKVKSILAHRPEDYQSFLQRKIRSSKGSKELMDLWKKYYESHVSSRLNNSTLER